MLLEECLESGETMENKDEKVAAIIPAAGAGKRMKAGMNKVWLTINGEPVLAHTLKVFQASNRIGRIVLVVNEAELPEFEKYLLSQKRLFQVPVDLVAGGAERQESVANGLGFLKTHATGGERYNLVLVHDAARALLTSEVLEIAIEAGQKYRAAAVGVPVKDTIKEVDPDGMVVDTPERDALWAVQTPQVFDFDLLYTSYLRAMEMGLRFTDDCGVVEYFEHPVQLVLGSYDNFKITTPEDLVVAEAILRRRNDANWTGF